MVNIINDIHFSVVRSNFDWFNEFIKTKQYLTILESDFWVDFVDSVEYIQKWAKITLSNFTILNWVITKVNSDLRKFCWSNNLDTSAIIISNNFSEKIIEFKLLFKLLWDFLIKNRNKEYNILSISLIPNQEIIEFILNFINEVEQIKLNTKLSIEKVIIIK